MLLHFGKLDGLDHLTDRSVGADEDRVTVLLGKIKGDVRKVCVFLYGCRCENYRAVVAVTAAAGELPIVALTLENVAESGADTHNVRNDCGNVVAAKVGDTLLLERESRTGRCGERSCAGAGCAEKHIDARNLGFGLNKLTADLSHSPGHILKYFRLRSDGVTAEEAAAGTQASFGKCLVAFHKNFCHR